MGTSTILICLIAALGYLDYFLGNSNVGRPLVMSTLVGAALGDIRLGIMTGATLELVWLGVFPIGASNPPDYTSGAILGTSYVIMSGTDPASAVLLAVPVATLVARFADIMMMFVIPMYAHKADHYAEAGDCDGVDRMHYMAIISLVIPQILFVGIAYYFGSSVIENVLAIIPDWLTNGLSYATGIIPAIGFALIARMILNKQLVCFLFLGFLLCAYLEIPVIGLAGIGACIVAFLYFNEKNSVQKVAGGVDDDNEF